MPASAFFLLGSSVLCLEAFKIHFSFFFRSDKWAFSRKKYLPSTQLLTKSQLCHCFIESEKKCNFGKILRFASKAKINLLLENLRIKWHQMILWIEEIIAKKFDFRFQNNLFYFLIYFEITVYVLCRSLLKPQELNNTRVNDLFHH